MKDIQEQLREAIKASGLTYYRIGRDCEIDHHTVARFTRGEQTITLTLAARITDRLGLKLVKKGD